MMSAATIQLVSPDLSHQETILQIVDALDHLDKITEEVFASVQSKIEQNASRLAKINERVDVADKKVKQLAEMSKKATCIYSSAKYPEESQVSYYESAFSGIQHRIDFEPKLQSIKLEPQEANPKGLDARDITEKRRYFHLPIKKKPTTTQLLEENPDLRRPSKNVRSSLSYLVFNSAENPYVKSGKDAQGWAQRNKLRREDSSDQEDEGLGEAPASLGFGLDSEVDGTADLFFAPSLGDLPDLDLPEILDLPNLPTDLSYMTDLGPGIAPSVQNLPNFNVEDSIPEDAEALLSGPPPPPPPEAAAPPPPPPEMMKIPPPMEIPQNIPVVTEIPKVELPPPPPPPPMLNDEDEDDLPDAPKGNPTEGRASLMAAIRNAGGSSKAGLKSVKERKMEEKKAKQEEMDNSGMVQAQSSSGGGGDLMSDLANKLAMRRKGMSGVQGQQNQQNPSTFGKMSMMIPALTEEPGQDQAESSDDDWN